MELPNAFTTFLQDIRPTDAQRTKLREAHERLRTRLQQDESLSGAIITTFLQGSYRRRTAVRPRDGQRPDVDIVVVTNLDETQHTVATAMGRFKPFLNKHYPERWRSQGRSFGIVMSDVDLDVVITSLPPKADISWWSRFLSLEDDESDWKSRPLRIPDRLGGSWHDTDPLGQNQFTSDKNRRTNGNFVNVVKAIKWWRIQHGDQLPTYPKGYPLERIVAEACPDDVRSVAEGVVSTFDWIARTPYKPRLNDYTVASNVLHQLSDSDWTAFHRVASTMAPIARHALHTTSPEDSHEIWRRIFGSKFPEWSGRGPNSNSGGGFPTPAGPGTHGRTRFA